MKIFIVVVDSLRAVAKEVQLTICDKVIVGIWSFDDRRLTNEECNIFEYNDFCRCEHTSTLLWEMDPKPREVFESERDDCVCM